MIDDAEVKTRHKKLLKEIREEKNGDGEINRGSVASGINSVPGTQESTQGDYRFLATGEEGITRVDGVAQRSDLGVRPLNAESEHAAPRVDLNNGTPGEVELSSEEKAERERELARQRKQRQRDREKSDRDVDSGLLISEKDDNSSSERDRDRDNRVTQNVTPIKNIVTQNGETSRFHIENPLDKLIGDVSDKLFTQTEIEEKQEKLAKILQQISTLPDLILEIIVKDHAKVQIWKLDQTEAMFLAEMMMEDAKKNKEDAKKVRSLLALERKVFTFSLASMRLRLTADHVKAHGGLSFK